MRCPAAVLGEAWEDLLATLIANFSFGAAELLGDHLPALAVQGDRRFGVRAEVVIPGRITRAAEVLLDQDCVLAVGQAEFRQRTVHPGLGARRGQHRDLHAGQP
jgi:hypothetical protein